MKPLLVCLIIVNALGFLLMLIDKYKAKKNLWRIPERTFFIIALMGGSLGCLGGMYISRHKTKHLSFTVGIPLILAVQIIISFLIYLKAAG